MGILLTMGVCYAITKLFLKLSTGVCKSSKCLNGKTALITGANSGIGYEIALNLASRGCRVILANKTIPEGLAATVCNKVENNHNIYIKYIDLASFKSIRQFCSEINSIEPRLDILINNAGTSGFGNKKTEDNIDYVTQVNYFGPCLMTYLLKDLLIKSAPSRVVFTSSSFAFANNLDAKGDMKQLIDPYGNPNPAKNLPKDFLIYNNSKLASIIMSNHIAKQLSPHNVTSNSVHPGLVNTPIYRKTFDRHLPWIAGSVFIGGMKLFMKNVYEGAQTTLYCAVSEEVAKSTGKHFWDCREMTILPKIMKDKKFCNMIVKETESIIKEKL